MSEGISTLALVKCGSQDQDMEQIPTQPPGYSLQKPEDLARIVVLITQLLGNDLTTEATVRFARLRPPDQADVLAQLDRDSQVKMLNLLTTRSLGMIVEEMERDEAIEFSSDLPPDQLSSVLDETSPKVAADILRGLPIDIAARTLEHMEDADDVVPLLNYEDDDAGGLMTPEFMALTEDMTVAQAMSAVRTWARDTSTEDVSYLFVVDGSDVLKGVVNLTQLVLARPYQRVSLLMRPDAFPVPADTDQEYCARLMERYNLPYLPVVDENGKLAGTLKLQDMIDVIEDEATEDMYRMIGVGEEEKALGPFWRSVRGRLPWLCVNLGTAVLAGFVITMFQSTLAQAVALAAFLPVIAGQGGIAGTQTLTLIVRSFALGEISPGHAKQLLVKEVGLGLVHGLALGVLVGVIVFYWKGSEYLALVVAISMVVNMIVAGISGVLVPFGFKALRIDPALASVVAVTTVTDVVGFLVYLGLATAAISLIVDSL